MSGLKQNNFDVILLLRVLLEEVRAGDNKYSYFVLLYLFSKFL